MHHVERAADVMRIAVIESRITAVIGIVNGAAGVAASDSLISSEPAATGRKSIFERNVSPE